MSKKKISTLVGGGKKKGENGKITLQIDYKALNEEHNISTSKVSKDVTNISSVFNEGEKKKESGYGESGRIISFIDDDKKGRYLELLSSSSQSSSSSSCFWCKHPLQERIPLQCPLSFDANIEKFNGEGVFCSFNCTKAYIQEERLKERVKYMNSISLLHYLYHLLCPDVPIQKIVIHPSPDWRFLKMFGGKMTIEEFRNSFKSVSYTDTRAYFIDTLKVYQKKEIF
jgi:hypothetical protein